ncbi:hypothetical protein R1sor_022060 [Riccia sorocarpa]|uniref:Nudix hydrolase domain-containing protein n=1 Tax=Riccia sorocarpa TaxID=122646 RepID=A0ABD3GN20_9MARC
MLRGGAECWSSRAVGTLEFGSREPMVAWLGVQMLGGMHFSKHVSSICNIGMRCSGSKRFSIRSSLHVENGGVREEKPQLYGPELQGFADRVAACNGGKARSSEFVPFKVEEYTVGYIHYRLVQRLKQFSDVFLTEGDEDLRRVPANSTPSYVTLNLNLSTPEMRTEAVGGILKTLRDEGLIRGWRNELYPVVLTYGERPFLLIERAAAKLFGIRAYGVHMNGYVTIDGEKHLWVAKRSDTKSTYAGRLDHIVAGGQPEGISCKENVIKECDEEAGIPRELAKKAVAVGAVSYDEIHDDCYSRDVLFCYDLELPVDFQPYNKDGEVQSFERTPVSEAVKIIRDTEEYKPNCALVVIDFFIRHGYITPEQKGYLHLIRSLRSGEIL